MGIKAKDIAQMLGVSTATISLVLNNKPGVGEQNLYFHLSQEYLSAGAHTQAL